MQETKFDPLKEEKQATELRAVCEKHICENPGVCLLESKLLVKREDIVRRWAAQRAHWNVEQGGLTLAEIWFVTLCYQQMAMYPPEGLVCEPVGCIALYNKLREWCRRREGAPGIETHMFEQVAYAVVFVLSHGLDEMATKAADQHYQSQNLEGLDKKQKAAKQAESDGLAGNAILGFIPLASRVFWCAWVDEMVCHNAEEAKFDKVELGKFQEWMKRQFAMPTQQAFRIALTELFYKDQVPTGGHTFHLRGSAAVGDSTPAYGLVQMELPESEQKTLADALESTIGEMGAENHICREMALYHMFTYTFGNRLQKGDKIMPFEPFIVHKWDLPDRLAEITGSLTQWGRPRRPMIVRTQTRTYVHCVDCSCSPVVADHRDGPRSCVLRRRVFQCPDAMHALFLWHSLVRHQFRDTLACSTSLAKLSSEVFEL